MKSKEIAKIYGFKPQEFDDFLEKNQLYMDVLPHGGYIVDDDAEMELVSKFRAMKKEEADKQEENIKREREKLDSIILTTTDNIENRRIVEYCGIMVAFGAYNNAYVGQELLQYFGTASANRTQEFSHAFSSYIEAINGIYNDLKKQAFHRGADAVIGIRPESVTAGSIVCVSLHGTAVKTVPLHDHVNKHNGNEQSENVTSAISCFDDRELKTIDTANNIREDDVEPDDSKTTGVNAGVMENCEICGQEVSNLTNVKVVDPSGIKYLNICNDCIKKYKAVEKNGKYKISSNTTLGSIKKFTHR